MSFLFDRDGHLLDLGIDALLAEELSAGELGDVNAHADGCAECAARVAAAKGILAEPLPLPPWRREPVQPANSPWRWAALLPVLAAAAALLAVVLPEGEGDYRARGSGFHVEVYRQADGASQLLVDGDRVHPGDALGFRVSLDEGQHVAIIGADDRSVFPIWPSEGGSRALEEGGPVALDSAFVLDEAPGTERVLGVACSEPFRLRSHEVRALLDGGERAGCAMEVVRLDKRAP